MSYDLAIWAGPAPGDDAEAAATYRALSAKWLGGDGLDPDVDDPTPPPALVRYVEALLERWPDITTDEGEDSPWASGPLTHDLTGPLFYVALQSSTADEAAPYCAAVAAAHGLVCYDPQTEQRRS